LAERPLQLATVRFKSCACWPGRTVNGCLPAARPMGGFGARSGKGRGCVKTRLLRSVAQQSALYGLVLIRNIHGAGERQHDIAHCRYGMTFSHSLGRLRPLAGSPMNDRSGWNAAVPDWLSERIRTIRRRAISGESEVRGCHGLRTTGANCCKRPVSPNEAAHSVRCFPPDLSAIKCGGRSRISQSPPGPP
jgi:hypothetical protein